jgi:hypothetical protein
MIKQQSVVMALRDDWGERVKLVGRFACLQPVFGQPYSRKRNNTYC